MSRNYIHSTCSQPMTFNVYEPKPAGSHDLVSRLLRKIRIGGGACVITESGTIPRNVITEVTDEELEILKSKPHFQYMCQKGFLSVRTEESWNVDSKTGGPTDMEKHDNTAQIEDEEHANGTDPRDDHAGTRASYSDQNQFGGKQPISVETSDFGPIRVS